MYCSQVELGDGEVVILVLGGLYPPGGGGGGAWYPGGGGGGGPPLASESVARDSRVVAVMAYMVDHLVLLLV
jgi:hypothetical protein